MVEETPQSSFLEEDNFLERLYNRLEMDADTLRRLAKINFPVLVRYRILHCYLFSYIAR